jgi:hypothetical protein
MGGAVEGDDGLAGAGGTGDAGGGGEGALDEVALRGVEEDGPGLPGRVEGGLELGARLHQVEAALGVGVGNALPV